MRIGKPPPSHNSALAAASSALKANQAHLRVIAQNLANADSTAPTAVMQADSKAAPGADGVKVSFIRPELGDFRRVHDPGHPAADAQGYVKMPNIDGLVESLDMREAQRAHEADLNVIETVGRRTAARSTCSANEG